MCVYSEKSPNSGLGTGLADLKLCQIRGQVAFSKRSKRSTIVYI